MTPAFHSTCLSSGTKPDAQAVSFRPGEVVGRSRPAKRRMRTRRTFVSRTVVLRPKAKEETAAAVYEPMPGRRSSSSVVSGTWLSRSAAMTSAASCSRRARRGYPSRSQAWRTSAVDAAARSAGVGHLSIQARHLGSTLDTGVCWDMISLTRIAQALVFGCLQGRSRAASSNQVMMVSWTRLSSGSATSGKAADDPEDFVSGPARCVIWMLIRFGLGSKR